MDYILKKYLKNILTDLYHFILLKILYPFTYRLYSKKDVISNKTVFIENDALYITDSFATIVKKLEINSKFNKKLYFCFLKQNKVSRLSYIKNCLNMIKEITNAEFIFLNTSSDVIACLKLNPKTKVIQTWHGCGAFKKFGLSSSSGTFGANRDIQVKYPYHAKYDLVTVSSPEAVWAYNDAMGFSPNTSNVTPIGVSRTDVFFNQEFINTSKERLYSKLPIEYNKKILLYMPTFRGNLINAKVPNNMDFKLMYDNLKDDYIILIKYHPLAKNIPNIPIEYNRFIFDCTNRFSSDELLCCTDILVTDYSSVVFEFSLFEKPIIFFTPDLDSYYNERGFYYKFEDFVPSEICRSTSELIKVIYNLNFQDTQKIVQFKEKFMSSCDGHSTDRIISWLISHSGKIAKR